MSLLDEPEVRDESAVDPSADRPIVPTDVEGAWSSDAGRLVDAVALVVAIHFAVTVVGGFPLARPLAVVHLLFFLGWITVRAFGARASTLTAVVAATVSVGLTIATSLAALHFTNWAWRSTASLLAALSVGLALAPHVRPSRSHPSAGDATPSANGHAPSTAPTTRRSTSIHPASTPSRTDRASGAAATTHAERAGGTTADDPWTVADRSTVGASTADVGPADHVDEVQPAIDLPYAPESRRTASARTGDEHRHLERGTVHLLINTAATGALGAAFWLFAARIADEAAVGTAVAGSSLLIAFAFLAQLNLPTALSRYVPGAGATQRDLVQRSYRDALVASVVLALGTIGVALARGGDVVTGGGWGLSLALAASIPVWVIFALQDAVLVAVRRTVWVPVENVVTTFAKYALVPLLLSLGGAGILLAWTLPALAAIPVVTAALWRRFLQPGHERFTGGGYLAYALKDFPGAAVYLLAFRLVPALVLETGDALDGAYIGLPWTILTVIALALPMLSRMLLAELSHDDADVRSLMRRAYLLIALVLAPGSIVGALAVRPVLSLAGEQYAERGSAVLALGLLGMAPAAVAECQLALLRFHDRAALTGVLQAVRGVLLLGAVIALIALDRVDQIGWAFVVVNVVGVGTALPFLRHDGHRRPGPAGAPAEPATAEAQAALAPPSDADVAASAVSNPSTVSGAARSEAATRVVRAGDLGQAPAATGASASARDDGSEAASEVSDAAGTASLHASDGHPAIGLRDAADADVERPVDRPLAVAASPLLLGTLVAVAAILSADVADVGAYGLIQATGWAHLGGTAIVVAGGVYLAAERGRRRWLVHAHVLATIVLLHGLPGLVEPNPRFGVAWLHTGFADAIARSGELLVDLDARFSWPGFFTGTALVQRITESDDTLWLIRFAPVLFSIVAVAGIEVLGRAVGRSSTQRSVAMLAFLVLNWSGQDYFSPQAVGFATYLAIVCLLVVRFPGAGLQADGRLARLVRARPLPATSGSTLGSLAVVFGLSLVLVATHQLTPGFLASATLLLAVTGSTRLRTLPWLIVLATVAWLSFAAESWWLGNIDTLFGSIGDAGGLVDDNVSQRTGGAVPERATVLLARIGAAAGLWLLAVLALAVSWWRRRTDVVLACLFFAPFPLFLAQPYGGEMIIRVLYFSLVPAVLLVVGLVGPLLVRPGHRLAVGIALALVVPVFMLARFGNEQFELVRDEDIATLEALYDEAPRSSAVFVASRQTLLDTSRVGELRFRVLDSLDVDEVADELDDELARRADHAFILLSRNQEVYWQLTRSLPEGWMQDFADELLADDRFELVAREGSAHVIRYVP